MSKRNRRKRRRSKRTRNRQPAPQRLEFYEAADGISTINGYDTKDRYGETYEGEWRWVDKNTIQWNLTGASADKAAITGAPLRGFLEQEQPDILTRWMDATVSQGTVYSVPEYTPINREINPGGTKATGVNELEATKDGVTRRMAYEYGRSPWLSLPEALEFDRIYLFNENNQFVARGSIDRTSVMDWDSFA